jgi:hypothetical protein
MSEYNNSTASGSSCSYASLDSYNAGYSMSVSPTGKPTSGVYIVPTYSPITTDSLVGAGSCTGYPNINQAYGAGAAKCQTTYRSSLCGGNKPN